ncbi:MAG: NAD(P)H-hydrate dehydratase [Bacteroidetes bacterium]|nr:NAD(P)H-hydrate dehydratase [Bacteroidota bacterium]
MLPVYNASEIKNWDNFTIENEPISSTNLMERAANACVEWIVKHISHEFKINIFAGNGNNGGDGFAIGRLLLHYNYKVAFYFKKSENRTSDNLINLKKIEDLNPTLLNILNDNSRFEFNENDIILDCIFGVGFKPPIDNFWNKIINSINNTGCKIISIDMPSGLLSEPANGFVPDKNTIVQAWHTLTFQVPKLSLLLPGWGDFAGNFTVININLKEKFKETNLSKINYFTIDDAKKKLIKRTKFSHKGTYGHALIIAGSEQKCGAAILCSKACLKSGAGLVTAVSNKICNTSLFLSVPEVMQNDGFDDIEKYNAIGIGPGIGFDVFAVEIVKNIITKTSVPLVIDADAIAILRKHNLKIPENSIITPHPKEFDNFAGNSQNSFERYQKAMKMAQELKITIVLKGANTAIFFNDGSVVFNSSGNPGMATAGSGDVLTGIITSLACQKYNLKDAATLGVFIHGMAGDLAASYNSLTGLSAMDIIDFLNPVFKELEN